MTVDEIRQVEDLVNTDVLGNFPARHYETTKDYAEQIGAIAFFGDKYGDIVRVLEAGPHSTELCGGTHVRALGDIGPVKIVSEGSIGSNLRRLEAISGFGPIERLRAEEAQIAEAAGALGVATDELVDAVERQRSEIKELRDELKGLKRQLASGRGRRARAARGRRCRRGAGRRVGSRVDCEIWRSPSATCPAFAPWYSVVRPKAVAWRWSRPSPTMRSTRAS